MPVAAKAKSEPARRRKAKPFLYAKDGTWRVRDGEKLLSLGVREADKEAADALLKAYVDAKKKGSTFTPPKLDQMRRSLSPVHLILARQKNSPDS